QELALGHPDRVGRLVLACTSPGGTKAFPTPKATIELMQARATLRQFTEHALQPDPRPEIVDRILVHRERTAQPFEHWAAQAAASATFDAHSRLGSLTMPTLVQTGDGDLVVDARNSELLANAIPNARLSVFPGAGHIFMWQEPQRFVAELEEFLC
ncbi:MAG TPA: alpha/beta fold hydrolase, partial [Gaiellaceae bacterium]|nr:alpha/beta fold hydrolase [Gaiellaceae bacterium]